jgi:hypothetical protein
MVIGLCAILGLQLIHCTDTQRESEVATFASNAVPTVISFMPAMTDEALKELGAPPIVC